MLMEDNNLSSSSTSKNVSGKDPWIYRMTSQRLADSIADLLIEYFSVNLEVDPKAYHRAFYLIWFVIARDFISIQNIVTVCFDSFGKKYWRNSELVGARYNVDNHNTEFVVLDESDSINYDKTYPVVRFKLENNNVSKENSVNIYNMYYKERSSDYPFGHQSIFSVNPVLFLKPNKLIQQKKEMLILSTEKSFVQDFINILGKTFRYSATNVDTAILILMQDVFPLIIHGYLYKLNGNEKDRMNVTMKRRKKDNIKLFEKKPKSKEADEFDEFDEFDEPDKSNEPEIIIDMDLLRQKLKDSVIFLMMMVMILILNLNHLKI
jgi:hypothetical protein